MTSPAALPPVVPSRLPALLIIGWVAAAVGLWFVLEYHLLLALLSGLLVHQLIHLLAPHLAGRFSGRGHAVALALLVAAVIGLVTPLVLASITWLTRAGQHLPHLELKVQMVIEHAHTQLPDILRQYLPRDVAQMQSSVAAWISEHLGELQIAGKTAVSAVVHVIIGMVLGGLVAFEEQRAPDSLRPLARTLTQRASLLAGAFRQIVFAQVRISALNTAFTALFLLVVLPAFGVHVPLVKTLILVTFVAGLLPVIGNLISNTAIVLVGLSVSIGVAFAALAFLVIIHKLEYFLNARIVGSRIHARAWELLAAMLVMEAAFGIAGLVAAPIYYAYVKRELSDAGLI